MDNNYKNIITVKFAQALQPKFEERKGKGYVEFGELNSYPDYLLSLFNESPKHGAIVKGKINYIYGKGFTDVPVDANTGGESWNCLLKKCITDDEIFGGYYLQIIYNLLGKIKDVYHIEFYKVRTNKEMNAFKIKNNWADGKEQMRDYPAFDNKYDPEHPIKILYVKQYNPRCNVYPLPNYFQGLNYIESDIQVSRHILGNAKDGFVATTLINLNGGEPQEEHKAAVEKGIKKKFTGSEGDRVVIMFNKSKDNAAEIVPLSSTMLTKEDFTNINNLITQEVFACHQVTSPTLFGIATAGALGQRNEIQDAYEIFNNTYVSERQEAHEETFNDLFEMMGIPNADFDIIPVEPLGFNLKEELLLDVLPRDYFLDKLGVDQKYYALPPARTQGATPIVPTVDAAGNPVAAANDNIKNLTGRQHQNVMRIVRQFISGKLTKAQASLMLKQGFQFTDDDVNVFLGLDTHEFSSQEDVLFKLSISGDNADDYDILCVTPVKEGFADIEELDTLEADVLRLIKKDSLITPKVLSEALNKDLKLINAVILRLTEQGILKAITVKIGQDEAIQRKVSNEPPRASDKPVTQIFIRYSYDWRSEVPSDQRNTSAHPSRPFCQQMMDMVASGKLWSRTDIERLSQTLGYSVWDRNGGWWSHGGAADPQCRHQWTAVAVTRKKK